jgi:hypothetical protein
MTGFQKRRAAALVSAAAMLFTLFCGCGKGNQAGEQTNQNGDTARSTVFVPEYFSLPENIMDLNHVCVYDQMLYFTSYGIISEETAEQEEDLPETTPEEAGAENSGYRGSAVRRRLFAGRLRSFDL